MAKLKNVCLNKYHKIEIRTCCLWGLPKICFWGLIYITGISTILNTLKVMFADDTNYCAVELGTTSVNFN